MRVMKNDFVLSENEFSMAVNKISNMAEALSDSIDSYVSILSEVQTNNGIKDQMICAELNAIMYLAKSYQGKISSVSKKLAATIINPVISDAEANDNFQFPSDFMTEVTYLLSQFI